MSLLDALPVGRRAFLGHTAAAFAGLASAAAWSTGRGTPAADAGYGPLSPVRDETTGQPLLRLPRGFRYLSLGWTGTRMDDGRKTPGAHDGMAVVRTDGYRVTLIRNHEIGGAGKPLGDEKHSYDPRGRGGCTNLVFDTCLGKLVGSWASLSGTARNCAGGPTPWGTWLTCEETLDGPETTALAPLVKGYQRPHGFVFEVAAHGVTAPVALQAMGRFNHEAVAVDPATGCVYETEDKDPAGFYRFTPTTPGKLARGGTLEMLRVEGEPDLRRASQSGATTHRCTWVPIADPLAAHTPGKTDGQGVFRQGKDQGGTSFARLEGCWYSGGRVYFTATSGGKARRGQVWEYEPRASTLRLVYESPDANTLDYPDNVTVSPRGGILVCEDGGARAKRMHGLTKTGQIFPFAENNIHLTAPLLGFKGNFREQEWAGVTFSPDGQWMFANVQTPGVTFAITGPWENGVL